MSTETTAADKLAADLIAANSPAAPAPLLKWVVPAPATDAPSLLAALPVAINGHNQIRIDASNSGNGLFIATLGNDKHGKPVSAWGTLEECRRGAVCWFVLKVGDNRGRTAETDAVFARVEALLAL